MGRKLLFVASTGAHLCQFHLPYLHQLREEGWTVHVACRCGSEKIPDAAAVVDVPFEKQMFSPANFCAARILRKKIRGEGYAAIIVHTSLAAFFTRLAVLGCKSRPKVINMVHGYLFDEQTSFAKRSILLTAEKLTAPVTDLLITMNRCDYEIATRHRLCRTISQIPGVGVDFPELEARRTGCPEVLRRSLGIQPEDFVLIYPAEFSNRKMHSVLLHAMTLLPENTVLVLPGAGQRLAKCRRLAKRLGISHRVRFPGYVTDIVPWYEMANAAVSSSRSEGLPFNIMEAMYFGLPVVASDAKGHRDLICHQESGLLYPRGDWAACADQIRQLMEAPTLAQALSQSAQKQVLQYRLSNVQPRVMELYRSVICEKGPQ